MTRAAVVALLVLVPGVAAAQVGEVQLGMVGAYGTADGRGAGLGLVGGVSIGRIGYTGLRWVSYEGTWRQEGGTAPVDVRDRVQTWTADLTLVIPVGPVEVMPGVALGAVQFRQEGHPANGPDWAGHVWEFCAAPTLAMEIYLGRLALLPEVQWVFSGAPTVGPGPDALPYPVDEDGPVASLRLVYHFDMGRFLR